MEEVLFSGVRGEHFYIGFSLSVQGGKTVVLDITSDHLSFFLMSSLYAIRCSDLNSLAEAEVKSFGSDLNSKLC